MILGKYRTPRSVWLIAFVVAVGLHAGAIAGLDWTKLVAPSPLEAVPPPPIEMVFTPETPAEEQDPSFFTELPPDRADEAPEKPDFLSNVDSRARDNADGGAVTALPRLEGESEAPQVQMDSGEPAAPEPAKPVPPVQETTRPETPDLAAEGITVQEKPEEKPQIEVPPRNPVTPILRRRPGASDIDQEAMFNPLGNASLPGDISMNTTAWNWAPWLQRFRREFMQVWYAPPAFYMGIIEGENVVELRILPDGKLAELTVLEEEGHPSLVQSSVQAFRALAPYHPLPDDFPEDQLVLRVKLMYKQPRSR